MSEEKKHSTNSEGQEQSTQKSQSTQTLVDLSKPLMSEGDNSSSGESSGGKDSGSSDNQKSSE